MGRGVAYSEHEDRQLCRSWIAISEDPVVGTDQTSASFWKSIFNHWVDHLPWETAERTADALMNHFSDINKEVQRFAECHDFVIRSLPSGAKNESVLRDAIIEYTRRTNKKQFKYMHCWEESKKSPKWASKTISRKKRDLDKELDNGAPRNDGIRGEDEKSTRPKGKKSAKLENHSNNPLGCISASMETKNEQFGHYMLFKMLMKPIEDIPHENRRVFEMMKQKYIEKYSQTTDND
ncbi:hypothetical protein Ae201684P_020469 [Aphanomyces euteiches]|uniref:No apical meristem-associated C-terminal domain-containing protein n=1 Tax=Aphanomyces euteiches TaxID=100861 RepID=A0A6G0WBY4_9STRA|nr:hypothetical protein Ae201684_016613 [Aphanomyces euteiches]KAH9084218.1 hypothetical protein Ae201684P_020469 [Aphanomyces euteiches]KAH9143324.1 hypothetical protein AeRB84_012669 [Aphanomyces euteiches]